MSPVSTVDGGSFVERLRRRGVLRVATSYAVIAWLLLQIADVTFEPLGIPGWAEAALLRIAIAGFPVAIALAWFAGGRLRQRSGASAAEDERAALPWRRYIDIIVIAALVLVVAVLLVRQAGLGRPPPPTSPAIAVLPFESLSVDRDKDYFAQGLAEEMLDRLGRVPGLRVVARSSSFAFADPTADPRTIATKLGVTVLLMGAVRSDGGRLRLTARLVDGSTGYQLWAGSYDRKVEDAFRVQEELARAVVDAVIPTARGEEALAARAPPTSDMSAHALVMRARAAHWSRNPEALRAAVEDYEAAIRADPGYASAYAGLVDSLLLWRYYARGIPAPADALQRAEAAAYRAVSLDPQLSEAHMALANVLRDKQAGGAEDEYRRALELNPNNAPAMHAYAVLLAAQERAPEVIELQTRVLELDPLAHVTRGNHLQMLAVSGKDDEYRSLLDEGLARYGDDPELLRSLVAALRYGDHPYDLARVASQEAKLDPDARPRALASFALAHVAADLEGARQLVAYAEARGLYDGHPLWRKLDLDLSGLQGDYERLDRLVAEALVRHPGDRSLHGVAGFWLEVRGRHAEALAQYEQAAPVLGPDPGPLGSSMAMQAMHAIPSALIASGRREEAIASISESRKILEELWKKYPGAAENRVNLAGLEAILGRRPEAVAALRQALAAAPIPLNFHPQLPWFASLAGTAGYSEVIDEYRRRTTRLKDDLAKLRSTVEGP